MPAVHIEVTGRVQGVGFRWFVRERARQLDLAGWVRNLEGGGVEVAAAGAAEAVERFTHIVTHGPPGAIVRQVAQLAPVDEASLSRPFAILR